MMSSIKLVHSHFGNNQQHTGFHLSIWSKYMYKVFLNTLNIYVQSTCHINDKMRQKQTFDKAENNIMIKLS